MRVVLQKEDSNEAPMYDSGDQKWQGLNYGMAVEMEALIAGVVTQTIEWGRQLAASIGQVFPVPNKPGK
jgi:hypothetical protein